MLSFLFGISLTLNIITVIGLIIYFSVKTRSSNKMFDNFIDNLETDEVDNKEIANDFMKDDKVDFSNLLKRS